MSWNSVKSMGQNLTNVISSKIEKSVNSVQAAAANSSFSLSGPEEFQLGRHTVIVKHRKAEGGFGVVDLVVDSFTQKEFALKRCNVERQDIYETVNKEIKHLTTLSQVSEHIVKIFDSCIVNRNGIQIALLLLENCTDGHLLSFLNNREGKYLRKADIMFFFKQICESVKVFHLNQPPLVHRDLKLENILMTQNYSLLKLCDFGSVASAIQSFTSSQERENMQDVINKTTTQMYRAPEMCDLYFRNVLTDKTDIWALGCIFFALCFLKHPFQDMSSLGIINGKYTIPKGFKKIKFSINGADNTSSFSNFDEFGSNDCNNKTNNLDDMADDDCIEIISRLLDVDPEARPNINELTHWVDCLINNHPLPAYTISDLALQCRAKRIEANKVRSKIVKNVAPTLQVTVSAPSVNSAAAKRLKARGLGNNLVDTNNLISTEELDFPQFEDNALQINTASVDNFSNDFDPFISTNQNSLSNSILPTISGGKNNDFFSPKIGNVISSSESLFDDFDAPLSQTSSKSTAFSSTSSPSFSSSHSPSFQNVKPSAPSFDAFSNDNKVKFSSPTSNSNSFESFDMFDSPVNTSTACNDSFTSSSSNVKKNTFDSSSGNPTPSTTKSTYFSSFDNFSASTTTSSSSSSNLDIFDTQPSLKNNSKNNNNLLLDDIFASAPPLHVSSTPLPPSNPNFTTSASASSLSSDFDLLSLDIPKPPPKPAKPIKKTEELLSLYNQAPPVPPANNYYQNNNRGLPSSQYQRPGMYQSQKPRDPFDNLKL